MTRIDHILIALSMTCATLPSCTEWHIDITTSTMTGNDTSQVTLVTQGIPSDATGSEESGGGTDTGDATTVGMSETTSDESTTVVEPTTGSMSSCPRTEFCGVRDCSQSGLPDMSELGDCGVLEQVCLMWEFTDEFCESLAKTCVEDEFTDAVSCQALAHWGDKLHICGDEGIGNLLDECLCFLACTPS